LEIVNVAVTGAVVPGLNAGTTTFAFVALTTVNPSSPIPESAMSTVTEFGPAVIDVKAFKLPGNTSVTVIVGVHTPGFGVGVAVGVGVGVAVGEGVGVGVGVAVGVGVGVGVGDPSEPFANSST
jgi:hypothetical protein